MDPENRTEPRTITIVAVVDVVGILASGSFAGSFYLIDNNRLRGSTGEGTDSLVTRVRPGDRIVWIAMTLECEAFASITAVGIEKEGQRQYCDPHSYVYPNTNIVCWVADVAANAGGARIPYNLSFRLGSRTAAMTTTTTPQLDVQD